MIRLFITILRFSTACMAAALFLSVPVKAQTDFVADYLTAFEEKNDYASANKFFAFLYQDKFTDDKIEFQKSASTDYANKYGTGQLNTITANNNTIRQKNLD